MCLGKSVMKEAFYFKIMIKPIPNFDGYFASDEGKIFSMRREFPSRKPRKTPVELKPFIRRNYLAVMVRKNGDNRSKPYQVSRLVLYAYVGVPKEKLVARHGKLGRFNNSPANLCWGTHKDNSQDMVRDGNSLVGTKNRASKLNELQVRIIRRSISSVPPKNQFDPISKYFLSYKYIAAMFNVSAQVIYSVVKRETWKHI